MEETVSEITDEKMIRECAEITGVLDTWQANFIDDMWKHHIDKGQSLSSAQRAKLKEAYDKVCESDQ